MEEFDRSSLYYVDSTPEGTRYSLYDTASWKNGLAFKNIDFSETGLPVIKIAELNNGISSSTAYTDKTYSQDVFLTKGDYVFSWSGNPETSIDIYKYNLSDGWLNQHIFKVTPKTEIIDKGFFFYLMKFLKPYFKKIATNKQTTGLGHVTISDLQRMSVALPPLPTQQKIAAILSSLDDKIELNNKINTNLEQQAQALFKNWFVDFEPFGGKMPEGWKVGKLSEIAEITMGQSPDGKSYNENGIGTVFYQGRAEFGTRFPTRRLFTTEPKRIAKKFDTLMSVRAPVGDLNIANEDCCIGRGLAAIHSKDNHQSFVHYTVLALRSQLDIFNGEGTVFGCINRDALNNMEIVIPAKNELDKFEQIVASLDADIYNRSEENDRLGNIRDTLLPKLMNGEITV